MIRKTMKRLLAIIVTGLLIHSASAGQHFPCNTPTMTTNSTDSVQSSGRTMPHSSMSVLHPASPRRTLIALKTNLLFDAALMPNIEIELPLANRWSLSGEYMFPWWTSDDNSRALQILSGSIEGRYWLGNRAHRERLSGHFLGLYAGGGKYDIENKGKGYQGEFYIASGLSYGYATRLNRSLNLELSLGIGYLVTEYRRYKGEENNDLLVWQYDGRYTWIGPTKAKVSLVWVLRKSAKKGGTQ